MAEGMMTMKEEQRKNKEKVRAVSFGVGVIGSMVAKTILEKKGDWLEIVGAIDVDPKKVGKELGAVAGAESSVIVRNNVEETLEETKPDIVIHTTSSFLEKTFQELKLLARCGVDVVSSCEELSYPFALYPGISEELDGLAKRNGVTILGTGINPGFLMDALPILLTAPCVEVRSIRVARQMDAATRRIPFQKKIGAGLSVSEFRDAIKEKKISGHVGLNQSISMLADSIGWDLEQVVIDEVEPVVLDHPVSSSYVTVEPGRVAGTRQNAYGFVGGERRINYEFSAYIGAEEQFDSVDVEGEPNVSFKSTPCVNGDSGTIAMLINMIPRVIAAEPGLLTMKDLKLPSGVNL